MIDTPDEGFGVRRCGAPCSRGSIMRTGVLRVVLGLAVVATSLIVRLRVRARTQMRAIPAPLLAVKELPA